MFYFSVLPLFIATASISTGAVLLACTANIILRKQAAAWRHYVWFIALAAPMITLPLLLSPFRLRLPLLPSRHQPVAAAHIIIQSKPVPMQVAASQLILDPRSFPAIKANLPLARPTAHFGRRRLDLVTLIWALPAFFCVFRLLIGQFSIARVLRVGGSLPPEKVALRLEEAQAALHVKRPVRLFLAQNGTVPFCFGIIRPTIIMPEHIARGEGPELDLCLKHELAHIARLDLLSLLIAYLGCALCWFNPLVWFAFGKLRDEAEGAADDMVLTYQAVPCDYAASLLSIAASARFQVLPTFAFPMARPNRLKRRIVSILDSTRSHLSPGALSLVTVGVFNLILLFSAISVRLVAAEAPGGTIPSHPALASGTLSLQIVDEQNLPVSGAKVQPDNCASSVGGHYCSTLWSDPATGREGDPVPTFISGTDGKVSVPYPAYLHGTETDCPTSHISFYVQKDGFGPANANFAISDGQAKVTLIRGTKITLRAISTDGSILRSPYAFLDSNDQSVSRIKWSRSPDGASVTSSEPFPAGSHKLMAVVCGTDGALYFSRIEEFTSSPSTPVLELSLPVSKGREVTGRLDDTVPRPVRNGIIIAFVEPHPEKAGLSPETDPDWMASVPISADGTFTLPSLPPGEIYITALCDGYVTAQAKPDLQRIIPQIFPASTSLPLVLGMEPTGGVHISVRAPDGSPIVGAELGFSPNESLDHSTSALLGQPGDSLDNLRLACGEPFGKTRGALPAAPTYSGKTDATGEIIIKNLPAGTGRLYFVNGHRETSMSVTVTGGKETSVKIVRPLTE